MPLDLAFIERGSGPTVVLLHGFPEFWYSWRHQIEPLAASGLRVVVPDLRGYNDSPKPREVDAYRPAELLGDVAALIERLGAPCMLVGHDWGGVLGWRLAMSRPDLVRRLAILNIPHPGPFLRELRAKSSQKVRMLYQLYFQPPRIPELLMPLLLPPLMRRAGRFTRQDIREYRRAWRKPGALRGMANYYRALRKYPGDLTAQIGRVEVPTLLIWGEREPTFIEATLDGMEEWVPDLRIAKIAGAGHFVQTDEPEIVSEILIEFLRPET